MAFDFKKAFNSQVKVANKLNQGLNKIIGKDVFGEVKELEDPREFDPYESFPAYTELEPVDWPLLEGERQEFNFAGNTISFPKELDTCMRYRKHRLTRAHREKQLKMSCQALHNAPPNRT